MPPSYCPVDVLLKKSLQKKVDRKLLTVLSFISKDPSAILDKRPKVTQSLLGYFRLPAFSVQ